MNAINSAYHPTNASSVQMSERNPERPSFWQRALAVLSQAGYAALIVG